MKSFQTILIEDNQPYAESLANAFLKTDLGVKIAAVYPNAESALENFPANPPDVILVDLNMPGMGGVACIAAVKERHPAVHSIVLTAFDDSNVLFDALKAGACGYLLKSTPPTEIAAAIQQAMAGGAPMSPQIARKVVGHFHRPTPSHPRLTRQETKVVELLATGARYKEIADSLSVGIETVRSHIKNVYSKLQVTSRMEAVTEYLLKRSGSADRVDGIRQVSEDDSPMRGAPERRIGLNLNQAGSGVSKIASLGPREREVLELLARDASYQEIADQLSLSIETIRMNVKHIYSKLQVHSRDEAVAIYLRKP